MNARVLITGSAGFLGTNLVPALVAKGYAVIGLDNLMHGHRSAVRELEGTGFRFIEGDVRDIATVRAAADGADVIIHFAEAKIPRYGGTRATLEANVIGTENVLAVAAQNGARVIYGSTDEVYGKNPERWLNEEAALVLGQTNVNRWAYAASKLLSEQLCFAYQESHGVKMTILRYTSGYGIHQSLDWQGGPQSVFITAALRGEKIPIHGDGLQSRTFTHAGDMVRGTVLALESPYADGEIFNIGSRDEITIINLAYLIWRLVKNPQKPRLEFVPYTDFSRNYEDVRHRALDISKASYLLGYEPRVNLADGLRETIQWQASMLGSPGEI
ncbi:MAG: NAD-dependent epimerase/dehydratase family protein [Methanomicrobiales archaeon]|nr:NAD-dependent epimerase/dehydratase family protein [Methanomicrobiales archaeon]